MADKEKEKFLLPISERKLIVENLRMVDQVITWDVSDDSANGAIKIVLSKLKINESIIFANGGDRKKQIYQNYQNLKITRGFFSNLVLAGTIKRIVVVQFYKSTKINFIDTLIFWIIIFNNSL